MIVESRPVTAGLIVDEVDEVLTVDDEQLEEPPAARAPARRAPSRRSTTGCSSCSTSSELLGARAARDAGCLAASREHARPSRHRPRERARRRLRRLAVHAPLPLRRARRAAASTVVGSAPRRAPRRSTLCAAAAPGRADARPRRCPASAGIDVLRALPRRRPGRDRRLGAHGRGLGARRRRAGDRRRRGHPKPGARHAARRASPRRSPTPCGAAAARRGDAAAPPARPSRRARGPPGAAARRPAPRRARRAARSPLVVIASSTGGPRALAALVPRLPTPVRRGVVIVQHMPAGFTATARARASTPPRRCACARRATATRSSPASLLLAPGDYHLHVERRPRPPRRRRPPIGGLRPRADITLADAARDYGNRVVLGRPHRHGQRRPRRASRAVKAAGGVVPRRGRGDLRRLRHAARGRARPASSDVVQPARRAARVHPRRGGSADGCATSTSTSARASAGSDRHRPRELQAPPDGAAHPLLRRPPDGSPSLDAYLKLLQARPRRRSTASSTASRSTSPSCTATRSSTRRCARRCCPSCPAPARLRDLVGRLLLRRRGVHARLPGARDLRPGVRTQIVGTDIDRRVVARAQRGRFSRGRHALVPPATLRALLRARSDGYQAGHELRGLCSFRTGDLLRDRYERGFDLVLCRNVVIYFTDGDPQPGAPRASRSALRPGGYLMVGATERVTEPGEIGLELDAPLHLPQGRLMDISDYLPMFLAEGREHLQNLNLALVRARAGPDATSRRSTRSSAIAHSLKGMSRDDGLRPHGGADARDGERHRAAAPERRRPAARCAERAVRAASTASSAMTDEIESAGTESTDPEPLIGAAARASRTPAEPARRPTTSSARRRIAEPAAARPRPPVATPVASWPPPAVERRGEARHADLARRLRHARRARVPGRCRRSSDRRPRSCPATRRSEAIESASSSGRAGRPGRRERRRRRDASRKLAARPGGHRRGRRRRAPHAARGRRPTRRAAPRDAAEAVAGPPASAPPPTPAAPWPPRRTRRAARRCASTPSGSTC